jgi:hypothetical protein
MKSAERGDAMGRPSQGSSLLGDPSAIFFGAEGGTGKNERKILPCEENWERSLFLLFLPSRAVCRGPQRSRARRILGAAAAAP